MCKKFHLRVYCVASGALKLYVYTRALALFSSKPYSAPECSDDEGTDIDLAPHLTNTSLQIHRGEETVRLLDELVGCQILSGNGDRTKLSTEHVKTIQSQVCDILADTFRAALETPVHFQVSWDYFGGFVGEVRLFALLLFLAHTPPTVCQNPMFRF